MRHFLYKFENYLTVHNLFFVKNAQRKFYRVEQGETGQRVKPDNQGVKPESMDKTDQIFISQLDTLFDLNKLCIRQGNFI